MVGSTQQVLSGIDLGQLSGFTSIAGYIIDEIADNNRSKAFFAKCIIESLIGADFDALSKARGDANVLNGGSDRADSMRDC